MSSSKKRRDRAKALHVRQTRVHFEVMDSYILTLKHKLNEVASKVAFDLLNQRDGHIRRMWPRHHTACSDQNSVKPMGAYIGAAQCGCQTWGRP